MGELAGVVRFVVFGGLLLLVGGGAFVSTMWPDGAARARTRQILWWSWAAVAVATPLGMGLHGARLGDLGLRDALKPSVLSSTLDTSPGDAALARLVLLVPAAFLLQLLPSAARLWWRALGVGVGLGLLTTAMLAGHADTGRWVELARVADVAHLFGAAVWLGGVVLLLAVVLRAGATDATDAGSLAERFSPVALGALAVVALTGAFQSVRQVATLEQIETPYGRLLIVKVVLVLGLIGVASLTRDALRGRLTEGSQPADGPTALRRVVGSQVLIGVLMLAVTALLVDTNPGGTAQVTTGPFDETHVVDDTSINVVVVPGSVGPTDVHLYVEHPGGGLTPPADAHATFSLESAGNRTIDVPLVDAGPKHWVANDVDIPVAGAWLLTVEVSLTQLDTATTTFTVPIGGSS